MLIEIFVIVIRNKKIEVDYIENKIVGKFMYKIRTCTKYHIFCKNLMKTITNNNLP